MKTCICCAEQKPFDLFHKDGKSKDGRKGRCKSCISEAIKADRKANPEKFLARGKKYRDNNPEKIAEYYRKYREENKSKVIAWQKDFEEKNKEHRATYRKKYYEQNKAIILAKGREYDKANPEKILAKAKKYREANPEKIAEISQNYRKNNPAIFSYHASKRNLAKLQRTPKWLTEFDELKIKCLYQVAAMRTKESGQKWHVDHVIPLRGKLVSGLHVPNNLRVITAVENRQKKNAYVIN